MKFPFFASFIILCLVVHRAISRNTKITKNSEEAFWQKENEANETRRKSLDTLNYISFSASALSPGQLLDAVSRDIVIANPQVGLIMDKLNLLEKSKLVNLNYITNTELKATYGVANLALLTEYDQNYTDFITVLQEYASILAQNGLIIPALTILETAISAGTDISASYSLAASIYKEQGQPEKIRELITRAEALNSPRKSAIVRMLNTIGQDNG
ncbi:MAG: hypothetical protein IJP31_08970 [Lachnospiraceae bacterium]|nr:hypothetical protein [Lachnospiraceae bacterium]